MRILFWPAFISGVVLAVAGFGAYVQKKQYRKRFSAYADAVIIDVVRCDRAGTRFRAIYEYTAHKNVVRMPGARAAGSPEAFTVGRKTVVQYDPHRPTEFIAMDGFDKSVLFLPLGILGAVTAGLAFLLIL